MYIVASLFTPSAVQHFGDVKVTNRVLVRTINNERDNSDATILLLNTATMVVYCKVCVIRDIWCERDSIYFSEETGVEGLNVTDKLRLYDNWYFTIDDRLFMMTSKSFDYINIKCRII